MKKTIKIAKRTYSPYAAKSERAAVAEWKRIRPKKEIAR